MKKDTRKTNGYLIAAAIEAVLALVLALLRFFATQAPYPVLLSLCDGFCISGLLTLFWALLSYVIRKGDLDGLFYICRIAANMVASEKTMQGKPRFIPYHEFCASREVRERNQKPIISAGLISFGFSLILFVIYKLIT